MTEFQSRFVLGGSSLSKLDHPMLDQFLLRAFDLGICEIDSAPTYGRLEKKLGQIIGDDPRWIVNTKIGSHDHLKFPIEGISSQLENTLTLLKRNHVGTVFVHSVPMIEFTKSIEDSIVKLKADGLSKHLGYSSNSDVNDLFRAIQLKIFERYQVTCSVLDQSNLKVVVHLLNEQFYFKRVLGSGVLKTSLVDDAKLQAKLLFGLNNRFSTNDYHYRFTQLFGFYRSRKKIAGEFLRFAFNLGETPRLIVGVSDINHLSRLVEFEKSFHSLRSEDMISLQNRFRNLESIHKWTPFR